MDNSRYARQIILPEMGERGQMILARSSVLIVGLGGLGAPVASYLTGAGLGRIGLCDSDVVSLSNLQRQILYTESEVGLPKCECALRRLSAISSHTAFDLYPSGLTAANAPEIIGQYDIVLDCCDNFGTRYIIDDTCRALSKPWVYASIGAFHGQVALMNGSKGVCYSNLYPDRTSLEARAASGGGVLGVVPGVVGAIEAGEAIKWLVGFGEPLDGRLFTIDIKTLQTDIIDLY